MTHGIDILTLNPARVLNVAMHLILEETDPKNRQRVIDQLTGKFRTMGDFNPEEINAPSWWHGDEEAYESSMAVMSGLPRRR